MSTDENNKKPEEKPLFDPEFFDPALFDTGSEPSYLLLENGSKLLLEDGISKLKLEDAELSNIHEPIAEHEKKIQDLELKFLSLRIDNKLNSIRIEEALAKLDNRKSSKEEKSQTKTNEIAELKAQIEELQKEATIYRPHWKITKDMHEQEVRETQQNDG